VEVNQDAVAGGGPEARFGELDRPPIVVVEELIRNWFFD
jgi:hypothetical protein